MPRLKAFIEKFLSAWESESGHESIKSHRISYTLFLSGDLPAAAKLLPVILPQPPHLSKAKNLLFFISKTVIP